MDAQTKANLEACGVDLKVTMERFMGREELLFKFLKKFENDESYIDHFDLPGAEPALTLEGVWFGYGAYEIAAFAAGMPECVVGYDKLYDLFTDYAKMIIKK